MIFVTVGTHEQQFNRLIKEVDRLKKECILKEDVFIQTGYSDYEPRFCQFEKFLSYSDMEKKIKDASLVVTHGGPASFMNVLSQGKNLIVVPRQKVFHEHVNNHQLEFLREVRDMYDINFIDEISDLEKAINLSVNKNIEFISNNEIFNQKLEKEIAELYE